MSLMSEKQRKAISEGQIKRFEERPTTEETKDKISESMTGKEKSEDHKKKISESQKLRWEKRKKSKKEW